MALPETAGGATGPVAAAGTWVATDTGAGAGFAGTAAFGATADAVTRAAAAPPRTERAVAPSPCAELAAALPARVAPPACATTFSALAAAPPACVAPPACAAPPARRALPTRAPPMRAVASCSARWSSVSSLRTASAAPRTAASVARTTRPSIFLIDSAENSYVAISSSLITSIPRCCRATSSALLHTPCHRWRSPGLHRSSAESGQA